MEDKLRNNLILALVAISIGGLLLHLKIHPIFIEGILEWAHLIPVSIGILNAVIIPCLFLKKNTADLAYLLTGMSVIFGIVTMSHLSIANWQGEVSIIKILFNTTLADSLILLSKFFIAKEIFESYYPQRTKLNCKFPQALRFLLPGWWLVHFIGIAVVYSLGVFLFSI